jgi:threonine dehydratase
MVLEGAGAVTIAAIRSGIEIPGTGPVGIVLSGGNAAPAVIERAMSA